MLWAYDRSLIRQDIVAWRYGPVVVDVYRSLLQWGRRSIKDLIADIRSEPYSSEEMSIIDQVYQNYGHMSGLRLSAMTHEIGTPWDSTYHEFGQNAVISKSLIKQHFLERYDRGG